MEGRIDQKKGNNVRSRSARIAALLSTVTLIAGLSVVGAQAAAATPPPVNPLSESDENHLRDFFTQYGVDVLTQDQLIAEFEAGQPWDSVTEGAEPVQTEEVSTSTADVSIATYADGSIAVSSVEKPAEGISARSWGCTFTNAAPYGGYWSNCWVSVNLGIIMQGFYLDYQNIAVTGGNKITNYRDYDYWIVGGALDNHRFSKINDKQVRYSADLSLAWRGFPVGWTSWMQANLSGNTITTTNN